MKRYKKDALALTKGTLVTSVGASAVTQAGGSAAGLNAFAGMAPTMGTAAGVGGALRMLKKLRR